MKNKKGYTLVELLAVVIILGILSSITAIAVINVKKKQDVNNFRNEISGILTGAKRYDTELPGAITSDGVILSNLVNKGYTDIDSYDRYKEVVSGINISGENHKIFYGQCPDTDNIKRKFYIILSYNTTDESGNVINNNVEYNDCGCEQQVASTTKAKKLCAIKNGSEVDADNEISNYLKSR